MNNLEDIYTKISFRIGNPIIVTYYYLGIKNTITLTLDDIYKFREITGFDEKDQFMIISFLSNDMVIESIRFVDSSIPIYHNPYVNSNIFNVKTNDGYVIDNDLLLEIKEKIFGNRDDEIDYDKIDDLICRYMSKETVCDYHDLFFSDKQKLEFEIFFEMLVNELKEYARKNGYDDKVELISSGTTSIVYSIGDKIVKIGKPRRRNYIPYCEYILQPIVNRDFYFDGYPIHVEVTQKVFTLDNIDGCAVHSDDERFIAITEELSKTLYSMGLSTIDLHPANVGILLKDNKIHYDEIMFTTGNETATSIECNNDLKILKTGRYVIIDLDCLEIENMSKYIKYLSSIGYDRKKIAELPFNSKCKSKRLIS